MTRRIGPSLFQAGVKRAIDVLGSSVALAVLSPVIFVAHQLAQREAGDTGFYRQVRIGRHGRQFRVLKFRTMRVSDSVGTVVTVKGDPRVTRWGRRLRRSKLDEVPQLWNVLIGEMSLVGPRPDVPGFADRLSGDDRDVLLVRPGITGPASIRWRYEEEILARVRSPETFNREFVYPDKLRVNLEYVRSFTLAKDLRYIVRTVWPKRGDTVTPEEILRVKAHHFVRPRRPLSADTRKDWYAAVWDQRPSK